MDITEIRSSEVDVNHQGKKVTFEKSNEILEKHEYSATYLMLGYVDGKIEYIADGDFEYGSDNFIELSNIEDVDPLDIPYYEKHYI